LSAARGILLQSKTKYNISDKTVQKYKNTGNYDKTGVGTTAGIEKN
jgi:hypothetical protein